MSTNQNLLRSAPYFPVHDVERSVEFYDQVLGFRCEYSAGAGLAIMLRRVSVADVIVPNEKQGGTWEAFFWVNDVMSLHSEFNTNGAVIVYGPLIQESYQMKEFAVRDCDGHVLGFGQALAVAS